MSTILSKINRGTVDLTPQIIEQIFGQGFPLSANEYPYVVGTKTSNIKLRPPELNQKRYNIPRFCYVEDTLSNLDFWGFTEMSVALYFIEKYVPEVFYVNWDSE